MDDTFDTDFSFDSHFMGTSGPSMFPPFPTAQYLPGHSSSERSHLSAHVPETEAHIEEVEEEEEELQENAEEGEKVNGPGEPQPKDEDFNPTNPIERFDITDLVKRWDVLQEEIVENIQKFSDAVLKNALQLILDTSQELWTRNGQTRKKLEEAVAVIQSEEDTQEEVGKRIAAFIKQMEEATCALTNEL